MLPANQIDDLWTSANGSDRASTDEVTGQSEG